MSLQKDRVCKKRCKNGLCFPLSHFLLFKFAGGNPQHKSYCCPKNFFFFFGAKKMKRSKN